MSRLTAGGRVDRGQPLSYVLDGVERTGLRGDTLASASIAADLLVVRPSMYRGRPRGIVAADRSEPNALVQVSHPFSEPMLPSPSVELVEGLRARSLAGVGRLDAAPETATYDKRFVHVDVLVVGGGPAGLAAALTASAGGARVMLVDNQSELGGDLLSGTPFLDGAPAPQWVEAVRAELADRPHVSVLSRSDAFGYYDANYVLVVERRTDHLDPPVPRHLSRQRIWHIRAGRVVLATGALERPMIFAGNDRPGVMLAGAVRQYVTRYAAVPGQRVVVATTNDSGYGVAVDLRAAGVTVAAVVDSRARAPLTLAGGLPAGTDVIEGSTVSATAGDPDTGCLTAARICKLDGAADELRELDCDVLAVSGGWGPDVHLFSQSGGTTRWDADLAAFLPASSRQAVRCAGAAAGLHGLAECLADGAAAGAQAARDTDWAGGHGSVAPTPDVSKTLETSAAPARPVWLAPSDGTNGAGDLRWTEHFVDLQRDATVADVLRATGAGMRSIEHVKRYTTIGTGQDQGRSSGTNAAAVVAQAIGAESPGDLGTTTYRPPTVPVLFAAMAGRDVGSLHDPARTTPIHSWHVRAGAVFEDVGQWKRPRYYPREGEDMDAAVLRECRAARTGVAMMDASTLGKIEIVGADGGEFLNRIYTNAFAKLAVGSARYGVMCDAAGMVMDDGVTMRLAPDRFLMSTTTGNAARVLDWLEEWHQTEWPDLDVAFTSVTEQWVTVAVVGPGSRDVVGGLAPDLDVDATAFPFMTFRDTTLAAGVPARIARISFSGELAYEVNVAGWYGISVWEAVLEAGAGAGITPYGTETMHVLRAEKGFPIIGQDTDGTVTPHDLGMSWVVSTKKEFVGKRSLGRPDTARPDRKHLVGLLPSDPDELLPEGAQLVAEDVEIAPDAGPVPMLGHVTSSYRSAALERTFALALVQNGRHRIGETVLAPLVGRTIAAVVTEPVLYDPAGARRDG